MVSNIYLLAGELKDLLDNDERIVRLNKLEKQMNENEEVMALSYQKDLAVSSYSDALNHYASEVRDLYFQVNEILFNDLSLHLKEKRVSK